MLFDFGAVSVRYTVPLEGPLESLIALSAAMEEETGAVADDARRCAGVVFDAIRGAIEGASIAPLTEDYVVYEIEALEPAAAPPELLATEPGVIARILRGEAAELSDDEVQDALSGADLVRPLGPDARRLERGARVRRGRGGRLLRPRVREHAAPRDAAARTGSSTGRSTAATRP